jgi:chemotaxis protein MotC
MTGRFRLVLAGVIVAVSAGASLSAPIEVSPTEDAALRQLFGSDTGGATDAKSGKASGNPFLAKPARKPAAPIPGVAPPSEPDPGAPIDLLARPSAAPAAKVEATPAPTAGKVTPAKKAVPKVSSAATKTATVVLMPLPRVRPVGGAADAIAALVLRKGSGDGQPAADPPQVDPIKPPVGAASEAAVASARAEAAMAQPAHPPSANGRPLPVDEGGPPHLLATAPLPATPAFNAAPFQLVRTLQLLQDQTAQGSAAAFVAERQLRIRIEDSFAKVDAKVWQDPLNAAAAVTYVLSGGAPDVLRHLSTLTPTPAIDHKLIDGALAYIEGRTDDASAALREVEANDLPASMGGQVALAQAALSVADDPDRAIQLLDTARLLAPGTLVEEAALRREILVADQVGDQTKFEFLSRQYLGRFRHSVYAGNFRYRFAAILTHVKFADEAAQTKSLDDMFRDLDPSTARELYLTVARAAVVQGKAKAAALAGERAGALSADGSTDQARAHLYRAAALAVIPDGLDSAIAEAQAIRPELLRGSDRMLRDAAVLTIEAIAKADTVATKAGGDPAVPKSADPSPIMLRAEKALQGADALLRETSH